MKFSLNLESLMSKIFSRVFDIHLSSWNLQLVEIENFRNFMDTEKGGTLEIDDILFFDK